MRSRIQARIQGMHMLSIFFAQAADYKTLRVRQLHPACFACNKRSVSIISYKYWSLIRTSYPHLQIFLDESAETSVRVLTIFISSIIFALCWSFILWLWCKRYVILRDSIVRKITTYPTELTLISTVVSTILSVTTTALFSVAVKHALSHYITRPLSLVELHTAIALTKPQPLIRWNHRKLSLITIVIVGLITLLNSSWTTLLLPTHLTWNVPI